VCALPLGGLGGGVGVGWWGCPLSSDPPLQIVGAPGLVLPRLPPDCRSAPAVL